MNTPTTDAATQARLEKLEQFKTEIEKKLFAAVAVATVLGVASIISGVWTTTLTRDLTELSTRTEKLQSALAQLDQQLASSITKLDNEKIRVLNEIDSRVKSANTQLSQEIASSITKLDNEKIRVLNEIDSRVKSANTQLSEESEKLISQQQKRLEASHSSSKDLIAKLSNGSLSLVVRGIQIRNSQGNIAAVLAADEKGDGFLRINTNKGEPSYGITLAGKGGAQTYFANPNGKLVMMAGVHTDSSSSIGFMRFFNMSDGTTLLELTSNSKGGSLYSYSKNGKEIVYLGPDSNTGNGFLGINTNKGEQRYGISLDGEGAAPQTYFRNPNGKLVLSAGVYTDGSSGYMRFWNMSGETKLLELATINSKGGVLSSYSTNGKDIVYLGPDSTTGNGLVNVYGILGKAISSSLAAKNYDLQQ